MFWVIGHATNRPQVFFTTSMSSIIEISIIEPIIFILETLPFFYYHSFIYFLHYRQIIKNERVEYLCFLSLFSQR